MYGQGYEDAEGWHLTGPTLMGIKAQIMDDDDLSEHQKKSTLVALAKLAAA